MNQIVNSAIDETVKIFRDVRIVNSTVGERCCIGDDCDIESSELKASSELGRRNLIRNTILGIGSYTGTNTVIKNTVIGKYTSISWNVSIGGGNHPYSHVSMYTDYWYRRTFGIDTEPQIELRNTVIGNDVWIAAGANVLGGVSVGNGSVIGAGCVVVKDIEPYSIVAGVPGRIIKKRFDDETIELLESIKWWNWTEEKILSNIELLKKPPDKILLRKLLELI